MFEEIKNNIVEKMSLSDDKEYLTIVCKDNVYKLKAEADCCSQSWIEHFDEIPSGAVILEIDRKEVETVEESDDHLLQKYFYEAKTDKGSFSIELRNESNGYYGGWLVLIEE